MVTDRDKAAAEKLKREGNALFAKGKYAAAIERYTEGITLWPDWPVPLVNRALCHKKRSDWGKVEEDCRAALALDREQFKAHFFLGQALKEKGDLTEAISHLTKALEQARERGDTIKDEIWRELARAKYSAWQAAAAARRAEQARLRQRLEAALAALAAAELADAAAGRLEPSQAMLAEWEAPAQAQSTPASPAVTASPSANNHSSEARAMSPAQSPVRPEDGGLATAPIERGQPGHTAGSTAPHTDGPPGDSADVVQWLQRAHAEQRAALDRLFDAASAPDRPGEPAAPFTCRLTMDVFREPAITPSGLSYERAALSDHLAKVGRWDPVTRRAMSEADVVPNLGLRAATQQYLDDHPWAWADAA